MKENNGKDIERRLKMAFKDKSYIKRLESSDKRWIDEKVDVVIKDILKFISTI